MEEQRRQGQRRIVRLRIAALGAAATLMVIAAVVEPSLAGAGLLLYGLVAVQMLIILGSLILELVRTNASTNRERRLLQTYPVALVALARRAAERDELERSVNGLRQLTERLRGQLRERDDAVASAVHELRTPLTSVNAYGQLMSKNLAAVQRQVQQLERLIEDLLGMPGAHAITTGEVDLVREAREAARRLELVTGRSVDVSTDGGPHKVLGDAGRLGQVLDNLLRNAAKFSSPETAIAIDARRLADEVVVAIADRGSGIPAEELALVFERYYRGPSASQQGEGIGLWVSREIVTAHGGRIWATSPGRSRGSTFYVALPAAPVIEVALGDDASTARSDPPADPRLSTTLEGGLR